MYGSENFVPAIAGGTAKFPYPYHDERWFSGNAPPQVEPWANENILAWVEERVASLAFPPHSRRLSLAELANLLADPSPYREMMAEGMEQRLHNRPEPGIFISYRGKYHQEVKELAERIKNGFIGKLKKKPTIVIDPGIFALDREFLSEGRRWMVLGLLDDEIRHCDELLVYETEDYLDSWWTRGELFATAYINNGDGNGLNPSPATRIKVYDPATKSVREDDGKYTLAIPEPQQKRMARLLSNTRPDTMGPESVKAFKLQRWLFRFGLGGWYLKQSRHLLQAGAMKKLVTDTLPMETNLSNGLWDEVEAQFSDVQAYKRYLQDPVFQDSFWDILCLDAAYAGNFGKKNAISSIASNGKPDTEMFINEPATNMLRIHQRELKILKTPGNTAEIRMPKNKSSLSVILAPCRYLWHPPRLGGMVKGKLQRLPTYLSIE